ncbi:uncharacterized protein LOC112461840 isoform X2 [Temnothorax curvispinosus]|nr:uncharacterized protein LOC112461840 isoform X2 [Temnothorax curvispinosus]
MWYNCPPLLLQLSRRLGRRIGGGYLPIICLATTVIATCKINLPTIVAIRHEKIKRLNANKKLYTRSALSVNTYEKEYKGRHSSNVITLWDLKGLYIKASPCMASSKRKSTSKANKVANKARVVRKDKAMASKILVVLVMVSIIGLIVPEISAVPAYYFFGGQRKCNPGKWYRVECIYCICTEAGTEDCRDEYCGYFLPGTNTWVKTPVVPVPDDYWQ